MFLKRVFFFFYHQVENSQTRMSRYDLENNVVEIHYDTAVNQWLVVKKLLDASNISSQVSTCSHSAS